VQNIYGDIEYLERTELCFIIKRTLQIFKVEKANRYKLTNLLVLIHKTLNCLLKVIYSVSISLFPMAVFLLLLDHQASSYFALSAD
jgi:hypothetical protein